MKTPLEDFMDKGNYSHSYSLAFENTSITTLKQKILNKEDVILYGPPGTGKSHMIDQVMEELGDQIGLKKVVQFHTEYSYDDFILGLKPQENGTFKYTPGDFFQFCMDVKAREESKFDENSIHLFFIDEMNRADITSVFGETMYLIENKGQRVLQLPNYSEPFSIPPNILIIGTMNSADKSLGKLDFALRRRFKYLPVFPDKNILKVMLLNLGTNFEEIFIDFTLEDYLEAFEKLNYKIRRHPLLGKELTLGHVLWCPKWIQDKDYSLDDFLDIFRELIFPQLESYCSSNAETLISLIGSELKDSITFGYIISNEQIIALITVLKNYAILEGKI